MTTINDNIKMLNDTKNSIKEALENKGVVVEGVPFGEWHNLISEISSGINPYEQMLKDISFKMCEDLGITDISTNYTPVSKLPHRTRAAYLPHINTSNIQNFDNFFYSFNTLRELPDNDYSNITSAYQFCSGCTSLTHLPEIDFSNTISLRDLCSNCYCLVHVGKLYSSRCTDFRNIFTNCFNLETVGSIDFTSEDKYMYTSNIFDYCESLINLTIEPNTLNWSKSFNKCLLYLRNH